MTFKYFYCSLKKNDPKAPGQKLFLSLKVYFSNFIVKKIKSKNLFYPLMIFQMTLVSFEKIKIPFISNLYFCVEKGKMKKKNIMDSLWISIIFFSHVLEFLLMSLKYNKIHKKKFN